MICIGKIKLAVEQGMPEAFCHRLVGCEQYRNGPAGQQQGLAILGKFPGSP